MTATCDLLPIVRVGEISSEQQGQRWLVEELWGDSSVGVIGGAPKCAKTWLGLDLALSVATGTPCLGRYGIPRPGPALVYLAEDALAVVRERVAGMARHRGIALESVDIHVITATSLRLDRQPHRSRLLATAEQLRPRLLLLDPLVRLHGIDENHAGEVAELLSYFRSLQRQLEMSVILVHHTRKNATGGVAAGQGLRGSSDLHAFGDSNLYLRRSRERLVLTSEHRAAAAFSEAPGPNGPPGFGAVIRLAKPYDRQSLLPQILAGTEPGTIKQIGKQIGDTHFSQARLPDRGSQCEFAAGSGGALPRHEIASRR